MVLSLLFVKRFDLSRRAVGRILQYCGKAKATKVNIILLRPVASTYGAGREGSIFTEAISYHYCGNYVLRGFTIGGLSSTCTSRELIVKALLPLPASSPFFLLISVGCLLKLHRPRYIHYTLPRQSISLAERDHSSRNRLALHTGVKRDLILLTRTSLLSFSVFLLCPSLCIHHGRSIE
jgi:hypothetical protein